jgi:nucleoside 2-deoxyribosyltransferase
MKYFIAYRFTGDDPAKVGKRVGLVADALKAAGHEVYHNADQAERYESSGMTPRQILDEGFAELDMCDAVLVLLAGNERSEGQLMEVGYAYAKGKRIVVALKTGVTTYVDLMADQVIEWSEMAELQERLRHELPVL